MEGCGGAPLVFGGLGGVPDAVSSFPGAQDVLYTICNPCGPVQRIVIFRKNGVQAMVEYPHAVYFWRGSLWVGPARPERFPNYYYGLTVFWFIPLGPSVSPFIISAQTRFGSSHLARAFP